MKIIPLWLYWTFATVLYIIGEAATKRFSTNRESNDLIIMWIVSNLSTIIWLGIMIHANQLTVMTAMWSIIAAFTSAGIGVLIYKESLTLSQWSGFMLALIAGFLLIK